MLLTLGVGAAAWAEADLAASAFGPGEQSTYRVHYLGITAGTAQITVGAEMTQWGKEVWPIVAVAKTDSVMAVYPVKDKFVTYWDAAEQRTIGNDLFADENRKRRRQRIKIDHQQGTAVVLKQKEGQSADEFQHEIQPGTFDIAAATFSLRNRTLKVGESYSIPVFTGDRTFNLEAVVESQQRIETGLGERDTFKVRVRTEFSGKLKSKRDLALYLTTDPLHLPVRIEAEFLLGKVLAEITDFKPGKASQQSVDG